MQDKKLSEKYKKRVVCNLTDYEYGEFLAALKYENITHPARLVKFFIESYLASDKSSREIVENYKQKNKISGRAKKDYIEKQEKIANKSEVLYNLKEEDIDDIYDILDETLPIWGKMTCDEICEKNNKPCLNSDCKHYLDFKDDLNCVIICARKNGPLTLQETSKRLGVSYVRIKQIEDKALNKIKQNLSYLNDVEF